MSVSDVLDRLVKDWEKPHSAVHNGKRTEFRLFCSVEYNKENRSLNCDVPSELADVWNFAKEVRLFEDYEYGQWGLVIYSYEISCKRTMKFKEERKRDYREGDLVIGEFLGDQDLLLLRCDRDSKDFGSVVVALPMDSRRDWYCISPNFEEFLEEYEKREGEKYWEVSEL